MAVELATAYLSLVPSLKGASQKISSELGSVDTASAGSEMGRKMGGGMVGSIKSLVAPAIAIMGSAMFAGFIKDAAAASDATDKFKATMSFAGLDTSAITAAKDAAKEYADQTVYDLPTIQNMTAQLASNGVADYTGLTRAAGNLNAVAGGNADTFKSVAMVMTQTAGAGKLTTENWNQMADAIPGAAGPLMKSLQEAGAYTGNFRDAMAAGQISSDEFNASLMKLGNDPVAVEAAKSTKTFEGAIGSLQATINSGLMSALDAMKPAITGAISGLSNGLGAIFAGFGAIVTLFKTGDFTGGIGKALGVEEDSKIVDIILTIREAVKDFFAGFRKGVDDVGSNQSAFAHWGAAVFGVFAATKETIREFFEGIKTGSAFVGPSLAGAFGGIGNTLHSVFASIGPIFAQLGPAIMGILPSIMTLMQSFSPLGIMLNALMPVLPILAGAAGQLATVLTNSLAAVLKTLAPIIVGIVSGISSGVTWFMSLHGAATALATGITALVVGLGVYKAVMFAISAATKAWAIVQGVLNAVMAINPVTLIIIGIAALIAAIVLLVMNWDTVVKFITNIWGGFVGWFAGVMGGFLGFLGGIWNNIVNSVVGFVAAIFTPIASGFTAVWNFIAGIFTAIGNFIGGVWNWIVTLVGNILKAFWKVHGDQITAIWNFIVSIFTAIGNFFIGVWNWYIGIITGVLSAIWGVISSVFSAVWGFISGIFGAIGGFIAGVWNAVVGVISGAVGAVWGVISSGFGMAWDFISSVFGQVAGYLGGIWANIVNGVSSMIGQVGGFFSGLWGTISGALSGAGTWLFEAGKNIVDGLFSGIKSLAGTIGSFFLGLLPGWIVDPFKIALGIQSPSKLFRQFGRHIGEGLMLGTADTKDDIGASMRDLVSVPDLPSFGAPAASIAGSGSSRSGTTNNWTINQVDDPIGTSHAIARRQNAMAV